MIIDLKIGVMEISFNQRNLLKLIVLNVIDYIELVGENQIVVIIDEMDVDVIKVIEDEIDLIYLLKNVVVI